MLRQVETKGLVLYNRNFREEDKLVKIFTEQAGKRMFFVKHAAKSKLTSMIQPLVVADLLVKINDEGLSYIEDYHSVATFSGINQDLFKLAHATYIAALADAGIQDYQIARALFAFLLTTLDRMEKGFDEAILTNIFEIQILSRFGVSLNFHDCVFCHRTSQPFDFSFRYNGVLCPEHYKKDSCRCQLDPNVPYLLDQFQAVKFEGLTTISLHDEMKAKLRQFIDQLYEEYVGIHLKPKKFLDSLQDWGQILKKNEEQK